LGVEHAKAWKINTYLLIGNNVRLKEEGDQLIWSLNPVRAYVPRLCYKALTKEGRADQKFGGGKLYGN